MSTMHYPGTRVNVLTITNSQMAVFAHCAHGDFVTRVAEFLRVHVETSDNLRRSFSTQEIEFSVDQATKLGLITELEVMSFIVAAVYLGIDRVSTADIIGRLGSGETVESNISFLEGLIINYNN